MRASRLLTILLILQARGRVTAQVLADECEVSLRTIYRDVDALSEAGVPVYSDRGSTGGYRLLDGYRTRLNGLSAREAEAMFLSGLSGTAASLGLGAAMAAAQLKFATALPLELRSTADRVRSRFHLDAAGWFHSAEEPDALQDIASAVWESRLVEVRYRSWKSERQRRVSPLGIVLKGGAWYLVAAAEGSVRTYRISRIREFTMLEEFFERPADFDLPGYWKENTRRLETELHEGTAIVRLSPTGMKLLEPFTSSFAQSQMEVGDIDADGHRTVTLPVGSILHACSDVLRFGSHAEVLGPPELRAQVRATVHALSQLYMTEARGDDMKGSIIAGCNQPEWEARSELSSNSPPAKCGPITRRRATD